MSLSLPVLYVCLAGLDYSMTYVESQVVCECEVLSFCDLWMKGARAFFASSVVGQAWLRQAQPLLYSAVAHLSCIVVAALASAMLAPPRSLQKSLPHLCRTTEWCILKVSSKIRETFNATRRK